MKIKMHTSRLLDDEKSCAYKGTITIDMPPHHERTRLMLKSIEGFSQDDAGKLPKASEGIGFDKVKKMGEAAAQFSENVFGLIASCDLVGPENHKITDKEELWCHPDTMPLVEGLVGKFMNNFAGNKNAP